MIPTEATCPECGETTVQVPCDEEAYAISKAELDAMEHGLRGTGEPLP